MVRLINKEVYADYEIELNEYDLSCIIRGLELIEVQNASNPEMPCMNYESALLAELKEIKDKR